MPQHPILRYHGSKWKIAPWVIEHFPPHLVYVEPFGGAASVLCRKPPARSEVYNDLDGEIVNVFRVLRDPAAAASLAEQCRLTPYARDELELASLPCDDPIEQARRTLFRAWASFGSAGATGGRTGFRAHTGPNSRYAPPTELWARVCEIVPAFTERFRNVVIENRPAIEVMRQHDSPETLHYVDPPYVPDTRAFEGGRYYRHELTSDEHKALLDELLALKGMVVLSGYQNTLYAERLHAWQHAERRVCASGRHGGVPRTEALWINPAAQKRLHQQDLFDFDTPTPPALAEARP